MADSFITSPSLPVSISPPLPFMLEVSMNRIWPPTGVQASPVANPGPQLRALVSGKNRCGPRKS